MCLIPSLGLHKVAGGYGGIRIYSRPRITVPFPFPFPAGDHTVLARDWYKRGHQELQNSRSYYETCGGGAIAYGAERLQFPGPSPWTVGLPLGHRQPAGERLLRRRFFTIQLEL